MADNEIDCNKKRTLTLNKSSITMNDTGEFIRTGNAAKSRMVQVVRKNRSKNVKDDFDVDLSTNDYNKRKKILEKSVSDEYQKKINTQLNEYDNTLMALHSASDEKLIDNNSTQEKNIINSELDKINIDKKENSEKKLDSKNTSFQNSDVFIKNDIDVVSVLSAARDNDNILQDNNSNVSVNEIPSNNSNQKQLQDNKNIKKNTIVKKQEKTQYFKKSTSDKDTAASLKNKKSIVVSSEIVGVKNWKTGLDQTSIEDERTRVRELFNRRQGSKKKNVITKNNTIIKNIVVFDGITIVSLAKLMSVKVFDVKRALKSLGIDASNNLNIDSAQLIVDFFGHKPFEENKSITVNSLIDSFNTTEMKPCPPVVTVMGHVDHGKTSLLDAIRKSNVVSSEVGGITQRTAAYQVRTKNGSDITFIDTPGHEAFTDMRLRGANITDLVILVVAADDGVMPQTIEAINHAKAANVPIIVAVNKIDKDGANVQKVLSNLLSYGIVTESMGGDVLMVEVSALKATNLDILENTIVLQSEISNILANYECPAHGVVLESKMIAGKGPCISALVKGGILQNGDIIVAGEYYGLVRSMTLWNNKKVNSASPATPIELVGLNGLPKVGEKFVTVSSNKLAKEIINNYRANVISIQQQKNSVALQVDDFFVVNTKKVFSLVLKSDSHGSYKAMLHVINGINNDEIDINIVHYGIGDINESDVLLATISKAKIIGFNISVDTKIFNMAKLRGIQITTHRIIYDVINDIRDEISAMLSPLITKKQIGNVSVRKIFVIDRTTIAGSYVVDGIVKKDMDVDVLRNGDCVFQGKIKSLQRAKNSVSEVNTGFECGIIIAGFNDIAEGDIIKVYEVTKQKRML